MEHSCEFIFLNYELKKRKDKEEKYMIFNCLDYKKSPCKFFIFDSNLINKIVERQFESLEEIDLTYQVTFNNNQWFVKLVDVLWVN